MDPNKKEPDIIGDLVPREPDPDDLDCYGPEGGSQSAFDSTKSTE